jgi:ABC-type sugar transport system substrate-binding protein
MKVTSTQIAQKLGVSRSTVSRALSGYPHVEEDLRQKILALAGEMNYRPNQAAQSLAKGDNLLIGVVIYNRPMEYWEQVLQGVELAKRQLHDYGVVVETVISDISKPEEQVEALNDLVHRGAKAVALAPSDPQALAGTVDRLMQDGVQVLLLNTDVPQSSRLCYIGSDYIQAGRLGGELICRFISGKGKVAAIAYDDSGTMISQKLTGFREELSRFPGVELLGPYKFSRVGERVYENTLELIKNQQPDAIYMTYGQLEDVARAVEDAGLTGRIALIGFDASPQGIAYLRKRVISAIIGQEPEQQGMVCVRILYDYLAWNIRPKSSVIHARLEVVTAQNSGYYRKNTLNASTYYL